ncbi:hypothetical protein O1611_g3956 [Lasiodiplodia mahajangana]|uniref:Uncharacterized protein n=1 Tax=Lasiodiplodia mahajangana TaxID=1108764 RepID=A0ACC2JQB6_9PEZI|nr:hypothetical protein O1611_g3956 [Lasiodiplodia mahajangana]
MSGAESNTVVYGGAASTIQHQTSARATEPMRLYLNEITYSVAAAGVGGPSRAGSDRVGEYSTLFASVNSLVPQGGTDIRVSAGSPCHRGPELIRDNTESGMQAAEAPSMKADLETT